MIYDPNTKHKFTKGKRKNIKTKVSSHPSSTVQPPESPKNLKFGSMNLNGLDAGTFGAVQELLETKEFDVRL